MTFRNRARVVWRAATAAALMVVPREWRDTVAGDLDHEAQARGRSPAWIAVEAARAGVALRVSLTGGQSMDDLRYVLRTLARAKWFTLGSIVTFALGIGVNVAMFAAVDRMLFRSLPYRDTRSLVTLQLCTQGGCGGAFPSALAYQLQSHSKTIEDITTVVGVFPDRFARWPGDDHPLAVLGAAPNMLRMLGVQPYIGRQISLDEEASADLFVWLAYDTWRARFDGDRNVVGSRLTRGEKSAVILGVLPKAFIPPVIFGAPSQWEGVLTKRDDWVRIASGRGSIAAPVARMRPGVSIEDVRAETSALVAAMKLDTGGSGTRVDVREAESGLFARYREPLMMVAVPSVLVLLLACVNLGALLLLRSRAGEHAAAVRMALGAGRARIIKAAVMESLVICLAGAMVGLAAIGAAVKAVLVNVPALYLRNAESFLDPRVLVMALLTITVSGVCAGVLPAWRLTRADVRALLSHTSKRGGAWRGGSALLAAEAGIGCLLVLGAFVTVRSLMQLTTEDLGVTLRGLHFVEVGVRNPPSPMTLSFMADVQRKSAAALVGLPGVRSLSLSELDPFSGAAPPINVPFVDGHAARYQMDASAFATLGMTFLAGRGFSPDDVAAKQSVVVFTESAARQLWPGESARAVVGRVWQPAGGTARTVVGVVKDVKTQYGRETAGLARVFIPLGDATGPSYEQVVVRTDGSPLSIDAMQARLEPVLGPVVVSDFDVSQAARRSVLDPRFRAGLFFVMGATAVLLLIAGLYATAGAEVEGRRYEMGLRLALGASSASVSRGVISHVVVPIVGGSLIGLTGAFGVARAADSYLYRVDSRDPWSYGLVLSGMVLVAVVAAWPAARSAAKTDPATVLRNT